MNDFEKRIKEKTDEELIKILICSQDYQPEFVELARKELLEVRGQSIENFVRNATDDKLSIYYVESIDNKMDNDFIELVKKELSENRHISLDSLQHKQKEEKKIVIERKKNSDRKKKKYGLENIFSYFSWCWRGYYYIIVQLYWTARMVFRYSRTNF